MAHKNHSSPRNKKLLGGGHKGHPAKPHMTERRRKKVVKDFMHDSGMHNKYSKGAKC